MTPHNIPSDLPEIPEDLSPDRPPTLNQTICGCKCGCAGCMCDNPGVEISTTSEVSDTRDGYSIQSDDLVTRLDELELGDYEHLEGLQRPPSGFFHATPYQIYPVDPGADFSADGDTDASISQFLHDHLPRPKRATLPP